MQKLNQQPVEKSYFTFRAGLNTDASPLNFPENFSSDEVNFVLNLDGSRERRNGLALEEGGVSSTFTTELVNSTPTVADLGSGQRGFTVTVYGKGYTIAYNQSLQRLIISWTGSLKDNTLPWVDVEIDSVEYRTSNLANISYRVGSGVLVWTAYYIGVTTFPALAATPTVVVNGSTIPTTGITRAHHWRNVNGNPDSNLVAVQFGDKLRIYPDTDIITEDSTYEEVDLLLFKTTDSTDLQVQTSPINTDYARGRLFVVGKYIDPFFIEWDSATANPISEAISIQERDFEGIDDGIDNTAQPVDAVSTHTYNLKNAGWSGVQLTTFVASQSKYPSKAMIPKYGMARGTTASVAEADWTKTFSPAKLVEELWQNTPAPIGHFFKSPFDTTVAYTTEAENSFAIAAVRIDASSGPDNVYIHVNGDPIIADGDSVTITRATWREETDDLKYYSWSLNGTHVISQDAISITGATSANPIVFTTSAAHKLETGATVTFASLPGNFGSNLNTNTYTITKTAANTFSIAVDGGGYTAYTSGGTATPQNAFFISKTIDAVLDPSGLQEERGTVNVVNIANASGYSTGYRPKSVAFYAGRIWYAGIHHYKLAHKIYFSQIIERDDQYGKCYQQADPTSEHISDLIASDGGVISIPEIDNVHEMIAYSGRLLIFADNGVWEISGGEDGYFKATGYSLRQISNIGSINAESIIVAEGIPFFWGEGGIYAIVQDENSGYLVLQDISTGRIQKLVTSLDKASKKQIQAAYDRNSKKIYWLYDEDSGTSYKYQNWLVLDLRINAFSKFRNYGAYEIRSIYDIENYHPDSEESRNIKFFCFSSDRVTMYVSELRDTTFEDFGVDAPAFVVTGYENHGEPSRRRYGKYLFSYMKRTETAYTDENDRWIPDNPSSVKVRYIWNWADTSNTGKWSSQQQAYKYPRMWIPASETDIRGESVLVSKLKIRGTGKTLQLRYDTEAGYDCHIYGWHMRNDVNMEA